jgi:hypothetical protein
MKDKFFFTNYIHHLIFIIAAFLFSYNLDKSMPDDGLRHISFAYNQNIMNSWGEVFPNSLFGAYDPWFMWHELLSIFSNFIDYEYIHIFINTLSLYTLMLLLAIHIKNEIKYNFSSLIYIVVFSLVFLTSFRYLMVRPDLLSGLFVFTALSINRRFLPIFILTVLYSPFYYLFFMYTGSIGLVYLIQKKWNAFLGVFLGSFISLMIFLLHDKDGYINTVLNILNDQKLRMGLEVGEGKPMFTFLSNINYFLLVFIFLSISIFLIYKKYDYFKNNNIPLFLLITSILWINQARYYYLFLPLILIYIISIVLNSNKKRLFYLYRKYQVFLIRNINYAKKSFIFYIIAIPYTIIIFAVAFNSQSLNKEIDEASFFKEKFFNDKIVLLNNINLDIYKALYHNPTIHFIPSCSVGWFSKENDKMKDIYIRMQKKEGINEEELYTLIKYTNADIYIHYLLNKEQVLDFNKLEKLGITPESIYHNRIIFNINKEIKNDK